MLLTEFFTSDLDEGIHDPNIFKAVFMAGPPGAGKNTVISHLGLTSSGLKLQDIDQVKAHLAKIKPNADYTDSLTTTIRRQNQYQTSMLGLTINTTGRDSENLMQLNKQLKNAGYDTFLLFVDVNYDIALTRINDRERTATNPADKRKVDMDYFVDAYDSSKKNMDFYALMFGAQFSLVTNNWATDDGQSQKEYAHSVRMAYKKINRFLHKPLTPIAQRIVDSSASDRNTTYRS